MAYQHSRYGHCDSYFVDEEDSLFALRAEKREHDRAVARMEQREIAARLSQQTAAVYKSDIVSHMEQMEFETMADVQSIDIQTEIQWFMRPYLLDFLVEAHMAFALLPETLFLAVNLLDRYCSKRVVYKRHYQLVGCAALLIAAKYGDRKERVPTIRELKSMCCSLYDDEMFTQMEWHVLSTLDWVIGHPTIDSFLKIYLIEGEDDVEVEHMTLFLAEIAQFYKEFVSIRPSVMARSALALARHILNRPQHEPPQWTPGYDHQVVTNIATHLPHASKVLARKYASMHLSSVSTVVEDFIRQHMMPRQLASQTPPVITPMIEQKPTVFAGPHTPQKVQHNGPTMQYGALTPPDTPQDDRYMDMTYAKHNVSMPNQPQHPQVFPPTPTEPNAQQLPPHYNYPPYMSSQHM